MTYTFRVLIVYYCNGIVCINFVKHYFSKLKFLRKITKIRTFKQLLHTYRVYHIQKTCNHIRDYFDNCNNFINYVNVGLLYKCYFMHNTSAICNNIAHKHAFNNVNRDASLVFEINYFTKTLLFCANFLRKIVKISISD
jgi:hypothetical protein